MFAIIALSFILSSWSQTNQVTLVDTRVSDQKTKRVNLNGQEQYVTTVNCQNKELQATGEGRSMDHSTANMKATFDCKAKLANLIRAQGNSNSGSTSSEVLPLKDKEKEIEITKNEQDITSVNNVTKEVILVNTNFTDSKTKRVKTNGQEIYVTTIKCQNSNFEVTGEGRSMDQGVSNSKARFNCSAQLAFLIKGQDKTIPVKSEEASVTNISATPTVVKSQTTLIEETIVAPVVVTDAKKIVTPNNVEPIIVKEDVITLGEEECRELLDDNIKKLIKDDTKNLLGLQTEITVLKLARLSQENGVRTIEDLVKKKSQELKKLDDGTLEKLRASYRQYGMIEDNNWIENEIKSIQGQRYANASYFQASKRLYGEKTSAFLLAYQAQNPKSGLDENDIAISWLLKHSQDRMANIKGAYSAEHNLLNLSNRVALLNQVIDNKPAPTAQKVDQLLSEKRNLLGKILNTFADQFKLENPGCFADDVFSGAGCISFNETIVTQLSQVIGKVGNEIRLAPKTQINMQKELGLKVKDYPLMFKQPKNP